MFTPTPNRDRLEHRKDEDLRDVPLLLCAELAPQLLVLQIEARLVTVVGDAERRAREVERVQLLLGLLGAVALLVLGTLARSGPVGVFAGVARALFRSVSGGGAPRRGAAIAL
jgi:hypothetical protein